jgi:ATP-dependent Clp protease ATP-binding subunit ClpA
MRQRIRAAQAAQEDQPRAAGSDRFDKFTERAKKVLTLAQSEAKRFNHNYIGTEHLLLGLVAEGEGIAAKVLTNLNVGLNQVRGAVEYVIGRGDRMVIGDISLTPRAKKVIELAVEEARQLNHNYIGTEHLLLGLIREGEGIAAGVLISLGVDMERAREQIIQVISQAPPGGDRGGAADPGTLAPFAGSKDSVITCRIASDDLEAIDALIEAGIRSTRSDAAAWLIHAGIQANLDLFDKVYSTVAEIKRLREQAQSAAKDLDSKGKPPGAPKA